MEEDPVIKILQDTYKKEGVDFISILKMALEYEKEKEEKSNGWYVKPCHYDIIKMVVDSIEIALKEERNNIFKSIG